MTYQDYIYACYSADPVYRLSIHYEDESSFNKVPIFKKYMSVDVSGDNVEVPCIFQDIICKAIYKNADRVNIPLVPLRTLDGESKTANPVIKEFFRTSHSGSSLFKKKAGGICYVGGRGIIMYEDLTPLIMFTLELQVHKENTNNNFVNLCTPVKQILRVNPIVYKKTDLIAKHIKNTLLKNILDMHFDWDTSLNGIPYRYRGRALRDAKLFTDRKLNWDFKVIIEDFSQFFITPAVPDCTFSSEKANTFLKSLLPSIKENMWS